MPAATTSTPTPASIPAIMAPPPQRRRRFWRSPAAVVGLAFLAAMILLCLGTLPYTLSPAPTAGDEVSSLPRYAAGQPREGRLPPSWWPHDEQDITRSMAAVAADPANTAQVAALAAADGITTDEALARRAGRTFDELRALWPSFFLGSDPLGRSLFLRLLAGGGISLLIGLAAAALSVCIGTLYGALAGYAGGKTDSVMMRIVDILYGLPYILLVVLLAVASDAALDEFVSRSKARATYTQDAAALVIAGQTGSTPDRAAVRLRLDTDDALAARLRAEALTRYPPREISPPVRTALDVVTLLVAIASVSWLTMARVIRGQVLSLKHQPFVEAARAMGASRRRIFARHLLPNLLGPIVVYATLAVPQAILQESFLSFLGIGVKPPLPSWGNLAADGLLELNTTRSHWWLLFFPCLLLGLTLLALNFVGEALRDAFDPKRARV
jgi:ABC-type dipeptide/oligopeptide/nickel transport system permease subunit